MNSEENRPLDQKENKIKKDNFLVLFSVGIFLIVVSIFLYWFFNLSSEKSNPEDALVVEYKDEIKEGFLNGNYDQSIQRGEILLSNGYVDNETLAILALNYLQKGSTSYKEDEYSKKAIGISDLMLENNSKDPEAYRIRGYAYEIIEDYESALENYNKLLEFNLYEDLAYSQIGHVYDLMGDKEKAFTNYSKALEINPTLDIALMNIGRYFFYENDYPKARESLLKSIEVSSLSALKSHSFQVLGEIELLDSNNIAKAEDYFIKSLGEDPNFVTSIVSMAEIQYEYAKIEKERGNDFSLNLGVSFSYINQALDIQTESVFAYLQQAKNFMLNSEFERAKESLNIALGNIEHDITLGKAEKIDVEDVIKELLNKVDN